MIFPKKEKRNFTGIKETGFRTIAFILTVIILAIIWQLITVFGDYPEYFFPGPSAVFFAMKKIAAEGLLWYHLKTTLSEMAGGLCLGLSLAIIIGYILAKRSFLENLTGPYIAALQAVPVVAIAPLIIIWFDTGMLSKVLICALMVFFPVLVNTIVGIRSVDEGLRTLMRSLHASKIQMFFKLEAPAALPVLLGGIKIGVSLSVIGAVVGEFVGADKGLGYLINVSKGMFNTALMFAAIIILAALSLFLYIILTWLEKSLLAWKK